MAPETAAVVEVEAEALLSISDHFQHAFASNALTARSWSAPTVVVGALTGPNRTTAAAAFAGILRAPEGVVDVAQWNVRYDNCRELDPTCQLVGMYVAADQLPTPDWLHQVGFNAAARIDGCDHLILVLLPRPVVEATTATTTPTSSGSPSAVGSAGQIASEGSSRRTASIHAWKGIRSTAADNEADSAWGRSPGWINVPCRAVVGRGSTASIVLRDILRHGRKLSPFTQIEPTLPPHHLSPLPLRSPSSGKGASDADPMSSSLRGINADPVMEVLDIAARPLRRAVAGSAKPAATPLLELEAQLRGWLKASERLEGQLSAILRGIDARNLSPVELCDVATVCGAYAADVASARTGEAARAMEQHGSQMYLTTAIAGIAQRAADAG